jgi:hypothetical protein
MKTVQRGATSIDLALTLSFSIGFLILTLTTLTPLLAWRDALTLNQQITTITDAAALSYKKEVMLSRCLHQTTPMSLNRLIGEKHVPSDINQGLWTFGVKLIDLPIRSWTRPSQIETTVTFRTSDELQALAAHLPPSKADYLTLTFASPLRIDITDNWAHMNKHTGCYE